MKYIIDESKLKKFIEDTVEYARNFKTDLFTAKEIVKESGIIQDFLKSKQEVELVAEGVLGYSFNGYTIDKKLISDISYGKIGGRLHKLIKIYISKE